MHVGPELGDQDGAGRPAERERRHHSDHRDQRGGHPDPEHLLDRRFEAHLEEEDDDAEAGEQIDPRIDRDAGEPVDMDQGGVSHQHPGEELAEHGRLAQADRELAAQLGGDQDDRQVEEDDGEWVGVGHRVALRRA